MNKHGTANEYKHHDCRCEPCKGAYADYQRERFDRGNEFFTAMKLALGCQTCGYDAHPDALEIDHIDSERRDEPVRNFGFIKKNSYAFIWRAMTHENVQVLCSNCHQIKTNAENRARA